MGKVRRGSQATSKSRARTSRRTGRTITANSNNRNSGSGRNRGRNRSSGSDTSGTGKSDSLVRILLVPDVHVPHESPLAWATMLAAAREIKPRVVILLGDFADCESVSSHDKDPARLHRLRTELEVVKERLHELETLGAGEHVYIMGNHEDRLTRYIAQKAPALDGCFDLPSLLQLDNRWKTVPYQKGYHLGKLYLTHDTGEAGANAHRTAATTAMGSTVIGHTHRMAYEVKGKLGGKPYLAAMFGWLGDPDRATYLHQAKKAAHWVHGFGLGYMEPDGFVHVTPVPIVDGRCLVEGKIVRPEATSK